MKRYTFFIECSFTFQKTFPRCELKQWEDGNEGDFEPKDEVMDRLEERLTELIGKEFNLDTRVGLYCDPECVKVTEV